MIHFNNAGCGLLAGVVLETMVEHLELEAAIGGYEASAARADQVRDFHSEIAALINTRPANIAFSGSSTHAYANALSAIPFEAGDVILTTRDDFISNQIAFMSLRKRFGVRVVHAPDLPGGGVDVPAMSDLMRAHRPRLVAAIHIPTNSGLVQPIAEIGRLCRELGRRPARRRRRAHERHTRRGAVTLTGPRGTTAASLRPPGQWRNGDFPDTGSARACPGPAGRR